MNHVLNQFMMILLYFHMFSIWDPWIFHILGPQSGAPKWLRKAASPMSGILAEDSTGLGQTWTDTLSFCVCVFVPAFAPCVPYLFRCVANMALVLIPALCSVFAIFGVFLLILVLIIVVSIIVVFIVVVSIGGVLVLVSVLVLVLLTGA